MKEVILVYFLKWIFHAKLISIANVQSQDELSM